MSLFDRFNKHAKEQPSQEKDVSRVLGFDLDSGMRVEVITPDESMLFVAKLINPRGSHVQLQQVSPIAVPLGEEPILVNIRGYSHRNKQAVSMQGMIAPIDEHTWSVTDLMVRKVGNDRSFFRLSTNLNATAIMSNDSGTEEKPCRLLDISIGGARIRSEFQYHEGDTFLLKVKLLANQPASELPSQVIRVLKKDDNKFEYGCQFLGLTEANQEKIMQNIFTAELRRNRK